MISQLNKLIESARNDMFDEAYDIVDDETNKCENNRSNKQISQILWRCYRIIRGTIKDIEHAAENDIVETLKNSKPNVKKNWSLPSG